MKSWGLAWTPSGGRGHPGGRRVFHWDLKRVGILSELGARLNFTLRIDWNHPVSAYQSTRLGTTGAWVRRGPLPAPGPPRARSPPPSATSARALHFHVPSEDGGSAPSGRGRARPAGVAGRRANRQQARSRSYQWAGASGNRGGRDSSPAGEPDEAHLDSCAGKLCSPLARANVSWARTSRLSF